MRAVRVEKLDGPDAVVVRDVPEPTPTPSQLVIEVHASPVVFPDLLMTRGEYQMKPELPFIPGGVAAGVVREAPAWSGFAAGDRVTSITRTGGWAEVAVGEVTSTFALPDPNSFTEGAAMSFNYATMYFAFMRRGRLRPGETVLVHGAAGGIGTASVKIASALGARVIAVVSSAEKGDVARAAGADEVLLTDGFKDAAKELTHGRGVDIVVDPVGGDRFTDSLRALAPEGRVLVVGFAAGEIPTVKVNRLLLNNIDVVGVRWGAFWKDRPSYLREEWYELAQLMTDGRLKPMVGDTYPLERAVEALKAIDERRATGNLMLEMR